MVDPQGPADVTLGTLHQDLSVLRQDVSAFRVETGEGFAGLRRELVETRTELAGILREMIAIHRLTLDELRGVNTRLDNFARGRGDGAPPV